jgi:hypothetical protein
MDGAGTADLRLREWLFMTVFVVAIAVILILWLRRPEIMPSVGGKAVRRAEFSFLPLATFHN